MQISLNKYLFSSYYMQDRDDQCVQVKGQILMPESWVLATALPLICCMNFGKLLVLSGPKFPHWYNVGVRLWILTMTYSSHVLWLWLALWSLASPFPFLGLSFLICKMGGRARLSPRYIEPVWYGHPSFPLLPAQGPEPSLQHTLASSTFLIKMQHTLNSICMTGWFFSSRRSSLQSVPSGSCQGRGGISLSDADSSCPSAGWMEWKWHHVYSGKMFPDPDQCQQDAGMLEDGKHARDQSLDLSWSTHCATHLPPLSLTCTQHNMPWRPTPPHTNRSPHIPHHLHTTHTPPIHHTDTYQPRHTPHTSHRHIPTTPHTTHITQTHTNHATDTPQHTSYRHISTHATMGAHTYAPHVHRYTNTQRRIQMHMVTPNLCIDSHSSHMHSGSGRAVGMGKKLQVLRCIIWTFSFSVTSQKWVLYHLVLRTVSRTEQQRQYLVLGRLWS